MVLSDKPQSMLVITNTSMELHSKNYMAGTGYHITLPYYDDWCYRQHSMQSQDISICVNMTHKHMNLSLYMYYLTLGRGCYRAHITDVCCKSWKYVVYREASIQRRKEEKMRVKTPVEHILQISPYKSRASLECDLAANYLNHHPSCEPKSPEVTICKPFITQL